MFNISPEHLPTIGLILNKMKAPIITQLLGAIVVGTITLLGTVNVLGTKIDYLSTQLKNVEIVLNRQDIRLRTVEREAAINTQSIVDASRKD